MTNHISRKYSESDPGTLPISWPRFLLVWASMAVAMSANGIFRETVLRRSLSGRAADVASAALGILVIGLITRAGFRTIDGNASKSHLVRLSIVLVALTVVFEFAIGRIVDRKSWTALLGHYALWRGELWPLVLGFLAVTPFLWAARSR